MKINKVFILLTAFIVLLEFASLGFFLLAPAVMAQTLTPAQQMESAFDNNKNLDVRNQLRVPFPQWEDLGKPTWEPCADSTDANPKLCMRIPWIAKYIGNLYKYGIVIGSILAVMMIMIGGVIYMTGGANPTMITRGKEYIVGAVTGIILLLGSYILLNTINPDLINLKTIDVEVVKEQMVPPDDCESIIANDNPKLKDKLTVSNYPSSGQTCGDKFDVQVNEKFKGNFQIDNNYKCTGTRCSAADKGCTNQISGKYECVPVLVFGNIEHYMDNDFAKFSEAFGGNAAHSITTRGSTAYVKYVEFRENDQTGYDDEMGNSHFTKADKKYVIARPSGWSPASNVDHYYLQIEVNDIYGGVLGMTYDDKYYVDKNGKPIAITSIPLKSINQCCIAKCTGKQTYELTAADCNDILIKKSDLVSKVVQVDTIDTNNFYCEAALADSKDADGVYYNVERCDHAKFGKSVGTSCANDRDCGSLDCNGSAQKCECNNDGDCNVGFVCEQRNTDFNQCVAGKKKDEPCTAGWQCLNVAKVCALGKCN